MAKFRTLFFLFFISFHCCYGQSNPDSIHFDNRIQSLHANLKKLNISFSLLQNQYKNSTEEFTAFRENVRKNDSIQKSEFSSLVLLNKSLSDSLVNSRQEYQTEIFALKQKLKQNRKAFVVISVILFLIIVVVFIYFQYLNYQTETHFTDELTQQSLSLEKNYTRLKYRFKRKLDTTSSQMDQRIKKDLAKQYKKITLRLEVLENNHIHITKKIRRLVKSKKK